MRLRTLTGLEREKLEKEYGIRVGLIPAERNPFELSPDGFLELVKLTEM